MPPLPTLDELEGFLAHILGTHRFPADDPRGVWGEPTADIRARPVARLGLALERWPGLAAWVRAERLDALWLHRPWTLVEHHGSLPADLGVLAHHLAFDEGLTTGWNPRLACVLGLGVHGRPLECIGEKGGRPLGMIGEVSVTGAGSFARLVEEVFGGLDPLPEQPAAAAESATGRDQPGGRAAVVGAMTEPLIREAAARGVGIYVTGQWRRPAEAAVRETGMAVLTVGHSRAERWGLCALAGLLRERWAGMKVTMPSAAGLDPFG